MALFKHRCFQGCITPSYCQSNAKGMCTISQILYIYSLYAYGHLRCSFTALLATASSYIYIHKCYIIVRASSVLYVSHNLNIVKLTNTMPALTRCQRLHPVTVNNYWLQSKQLYFILQLLLIYFQVCEVFCLKECSSSSSVIYDSCLVLLALSQVKSSENHA